MSCLFRGVAFNPTDDNQLFSASAGRIVDRLECADITSFSTDFATLEHSVWSIAASQGAGLVAAGDSDGTIAVYDAGGARVKNWAAMEVESSTWHLAQIGHYWPLAARIRR